MANRQTNFEEECNVPHGRGSSSGLVRIDGMPFVSPRGRGRGNPGRGRVDGLPFESPRGRGRNHGLVRIDGKPFESPRGRGRRKDVPTDADRFYEDDTSVHTKSCTYSEEDYLEEGGRPSQHDERESFRQGQSDAYIASAPIYEAIMDVDDN